MVDAWISAGIEPATLESIFEANFPTSGLEAVVKIFTALLAQERLCLPEGEGASSLPAGLEPATAKCVELKLPHALIYQIQVRYYGSRGGEKPNLTRAGWAMSPIAGCGDLA